MHVLIDGHAKGTANTPLHQRLSELRAAAVMQELLREGVASDHMAFQGTHSLFGEQPCIRTQFLGSQKDQN